jgi:hypothetical protein
MSFSTVYYGIGTSGLQVFSTLAALIYGMSHLHSFVPHSQWTTGNPGSNGPRMTPDKRACIDRSGQLPGGRQLNLSEHSQFRPTVGDVFRP